MFNSIKNLEVVNFIEERRGLFQAIIKTPAGFMTAYETGTTLPSLDRWKKGALQTILFKAEGSDYWIVVFARKGNRVMVMDEKLVEALTVNTIYSLFSNTNLMDLARYRVVNERSISFKGV